MQLNQEKSSSKSASRTSFKRGIFSVSLFLATPFLVSAATLPDLPDVASFASSVTKNVGSFIGDATINVAQAITVGTNESGDVARGVATVVTRGVTGTAHAFVSDAINTEHELIATFKLPLDFITSSALDYAHFTTGVGQRRSHRMSPMPHSHR